MAKGRKTGGRQAGVPNRATAELKAVAGEYTAEAIEILIGIARASESDAAKVSACRELLDRGHGKSTQAITADQNVTLQSHFSEADQAIIDRHFYRRLEEESKVTAAPKT